MISEANVVQDLEPLRYDELDELQRRVNLTDADLEDLKHILNGPILEQLKTLMKSVVVFFRDHWIMILIYSSLIVLIVVCLCALPYIRLIKLFFSCCCRSQPPKPEDWQLKSIN